MARNRDRRGESLAPGFHDFVPHNTVVAAVVVQANGIATDLIEAAVLNGAVLGIFHIEGITTRVRAIYVDKIGVQRVKGGKAIERLCKGQAGESQIAHRLSCRRSQFNQPIHQRNRDLCILDPFRRWPKVELVRLRVETPFAWLVEFLKQVLDVKAIAFGQVSKCRVSRRVTVIVRAS